MTRRAWLLAGAASALVALPLVLFLLGRAWRLGIPLGRSAKEVFFPDPRLNYWTYYFFFGALAFWALLAAVLGVLAGPRLAPRAWRWIHALAWPALFLGWHHCLHTGNEVREQFLGGLYTLMTACALGMLVFRIAGGRGSSDPPVGRPVSPGPDG